MEGPRRIKIRIHVHNFIINNIVGKTHGQQFPDGSDSSQQQTHHNKPSVIPQFLYHEIGPESLIRPIIIK